MSLLLCCGCSSGVIWEQKKRKRYTGVTMLQSQTLEEGYQHYLTELELARGQRIDGLRMLSDGKVQVLHEHFYDTIRYEMLF